MANRDADLARPLMQSINGDAGVPLKPVAGGDTAARAALASIKLDVSRLPATLVQRLYKDSFGDVSGSPAVGRVTKSYSRIESLATLEMTEPNVDYCGYAFACLFGCQNAELIKEGDVGILRDNESYQLLAPGYHRYSACGTEFVGFSSLNVVDSPVLFGASGFVTVSEGKICVLMVASEFKLLAPGTYQWDSPAVRFVGCADIREREVRLGPYTLVTVPDGEVVVTFDNGDLKMLGWDPAAAAEASGIAAVGADRTATAAASRTYFLNDPKWVVGPTLSVQMQTDRLESNDLLSKDNVEIIMVAMSQWRITDPAVAVRRCGADMKKIKDKVNQLVRATIARIVASTSIGAGPVSGHVVKPLVVAGAVVDRDGQPVKAGAVGDTASTTAAQEKAEHEKGLAQLMQSDAAVHHMNELRANVGSMGVEVVAVFVPEKRMKNDDIRSKVASQAIIGIQADAERSAADAKAYATVKAATAEAEAIALLAKAHAEAGARLGEPKSTAARLALTEVTAKSLERAKVTVFSGSPGNMPFMLNADDRGPQ